MPEQIRAEMFNLAAGLICLLTALGIGMILLRILGIVAPWYWHLSLALLLGIGMSETCFTSALYLGGGIRTIKIVSVVLLLPGLFFTGRQLTLCRFKPIAIGSRREWWPLAIVLAAFTINLFIALAPSTKIDELHYHMLVPKRVIEDNGLRPYQQPYEAAIFPQLAFQYSLSAVYVFGLPEAGNVISWGISATLVFFTIGTVTELTATRQAGLLFGAVAAVGLYTAVWHVTSGPHALGDLATTTAFCLFLLPEKVIAWAPLNKKLGLICAAAGMGASTKVTLLPAAAALSLLAWHNTAARIGWKSATMILAGVWTILFAPSIAWSSIHAGSPFGLATATLFHSHFFDSSTIAVMALAKQERLTGFLQLLRGLAPSLSIGFFLALGIIVSNSRKRTGLRTILLFLTAQMILIALFLPHDFRFLGGLQFVALIMAGWALALSPRGVRWLARSYWLVFPLCVPWLAIQTYYGAKFFPVDLGMESRQTFLNRYVAFSTDFRALDRILPRDAVLYVKNSPKNPSYYAPRPVIFTLGDATPGQRIYRFSVGTVDPESGLACNETIYENPHAVDYAFRTSEPLYDSLTVQKCLRF